MRKFLIIYNNISSGLIVPFFRTCHKYFMNQNHSVQESMQDFFMIPITKFFMKIDQELQSNKNNFSRRDSDLFKQKSFTQISKSDKEKFLFLTGEEFSQYRKRLIADLLSGPKNKDSAQQEEKPSKIKQEDQLRELHIFLKAPAKRKPVKRASSIARLPLSKKLNKIYESDYR